MASGIKSPAQIIREKLREREWTQRRLADALDVSPETVNRLWRGKSVISVSMARKLAAAFGDEAIDWLQRQAAWALKEVQDSEGERDAT